MLNPEDYEPIAVKVAEHPGLRISIRLTSEEADRFSALAERLGKRVPELARELLLRAIEADVPTP